MIQIRAAALTDIGKLRRENEDRFLKDDERLVFGVADGVGGVPGGAEAAQVAHDYVLGAIEKLAPEEEPDLWAIVAGASQSVTAKGASINPGTGIASTLTFGCVRGSLLMIAHVGDSRCYGLQRDRLVRFTQDHSVENEAARRRRLGEVAPYPPNQARALTQWLGGPFMPQPDLVSVPLSPGDRYLFCTDGVTGAVSDREIGWILGLPEEPETQLRKLVDLALNRGGLDNATGVLLRVDAL
jgi:protein phosphatase